MSAPPAPTVSVDLEAALKRLMATHPFTDNRVNGPDPETVDVPSIHGSAFARLTGLAEEALATRRGLGVLLAGEAGVGKSHVLARLARWAHERRAPYILLHNLQANPEHLARSVLRTVVSVLTLGRTSRFVNTPLFFQTAGFAHEALDRASGTTTWPKIRAGWLRLVSRLAADPVRAPFVDRTVFEVLYQFLHSAYKEKEGQGDGVAALAVRWLSGAPLDPEEARKLGLPGSAGLQECAALRDNQDVKNVLVAFSQLTLVRNTPFVLAFDQVDNLEPTQASALARFLEALIDSATGLLVVTSGVKNTLEEWHQGRIIQQSAWDRLAQFPLMLQKVRGPEAECLVAARLERLFSTLPHNEEIEKKRSEDSLFPLGHPWAKSILGDRAEYRPRDVLSRAREAWHAQQERLNALEPMEWLQSWNDVPNGPPASLPPPPPGDDVRHAIDRATARLVSDHHTRRKVQPQTLPWDAAHLAGLVVKLLEHYRAADPASGVLLAEREPPRRNNQRNPYDVVVRLRNPDGREISTGLLICSTNSAQANAHALRRIVQAIRPPDHCILVNDARTPLQLGPKGEEFLEQLKANPDTLFRQVDLSFSDYAYLDSLLAVLGEARSGGFSLQDSRYPDHLVTEGEVQASYQRLGCFREAPLLREVLSR